MGLHVGTSAALPISDAAIPDRVYQILGAFAVVCRVIVCSPKNRHLEWEGGTSEQTGVMTSSWWSMWVVQSVYEVLLRIEF